MRQRPGARAYLALAAVCFFWGTTYLGIRMSLETFPPYVLISTRFILSGVIMLAGALARGARLPRGRDLWKAGLSGILILSIGNGCLTFAELRIASGLASLVITLSPFWLVGIEAMARGGERLHPPTILGMIVGFGGAALLVSGGVGSGGIGPAALVGFLILQVGMISWSAGSIYQRRQQVDAHPIVVGAVQQVFGGLAVLPFAVFASSHHIAWSARGVSALFYLVTFGSIVGYSAYVYALDRLPVAVVSIYPYANSVVAVALGWLFYREPFGVREAAAMLVIFAGVAVVKWQGGKAALAKMEVEA
ncbi:MAG: EamA family transporter [Acidobacteriia bacterium]|nr:EamA family transporter [Terriglobia bacterium]